MQCSVMHLGAWNVAILGIKHMLAESREKRGLAYATGKRSGGKKRTMYSRGKSSEPDESKSSLGTHGATVPVVKTSTVVTGGNNTDPKRKRQASPDEQFPREAKTTKLSGGETTWQQSATPWEPKAMKKPMDATCAGRSQRSKQITHTNSGICSALPYTKRQQQ